MEMASVLAGERWSDHPGCTHPLLAELARQVNDRTGDSGRQELVSLIPTVVGRLGDERTCVTVSVAVAAHVVLDVPEATQRVLAGGLLQAEQQCADGGPELAATRRAARAALELVPGAVAWVEGLGVRRRITAKTFAKYCAPTMVRCAVDGVAEAGSADCDRRLRDLLDVGIAACPVPEAAAHPGTGVPQPLR